MPFLCAFRMKAGIDNVLMFVRSPSLLACLLVCCVHPGYEACLQQVSAGVDFVEDHPHPSESCALFMFLRTRDLHILRRRSDTHGVGILDDELVSANRKSESVDLPSHASSMRAASAAWVW